MILSEVSYPQASKLLKQPQEQLVIHGKCTRTRIGYAYAMPVKFTKTLGGNQDSKNPQKRQSQEFK